MATPPSSFQSFGFNPFQLINETTPEKRRPDAGEERQQRAGIRVRYNLESVYERAYGESPKVAHNAESDVLTLLLSAIAKPVDFVSLVERTAIPFDTIKKCW